MVPGSSKLIPWHPLSIQEIKKLTPDQAQDLKNSTAKINRSVMGYARRMNWTVKAIPYPAGLLVTRMK
jgi:DNA polymerase/3'-5' exonuclease PolX